MHRSLISPLFFPIAFGLCWLSLTKSDKPSLFRPTFPHPFSCCHSSRSLKVVHASLIFIHPYAQELLNRAEIKKTTIIEQLSNFIMDEQFHASLLEDNLNCLFWRSLFSTVCIRVVCFMEPEYLLYYYYTVLFFVLINPFLLNQTVFCLLLGIK